MIEATIVLPAYNAGETIERAVHTAVGQAPVIVADDGSDDDTADRAEAAGATVLRLQHGGRPHAANAAWRAADSLWCYFHAADDWLDPDALAAILAHSRATSDEAEPALVYSDLMLHDRFGEPRGQTWSYRNVTPDAIYTSLRQSGQAPIPSSGGCLWRRDWLDAVGGFVEPICMDTDLLSRAVIRPGFSARHAPGARYHYRWSPDKVTSAAKAEVTVKIMRRHGATSADFRRKWYSWGCRAEAAAFLEASR